MRELSASAPGLARAVLALYQEYRNARESAQTLALRLEGRDDLTGVDRSRLPSEEVSDLLQRHVNYFPELEEDAEALRRDARLDGEDLYQALVRHLEAAFSVQVRVETVTAMRGAVRRYDGQSRVLSLSEALRRGSRNFQVAHQIGLLRESATLDRIANDPLLTTDESRALGRVTLANYFAGAVVMPYRPLLRSGAGGAIRHRAAGPPLPRQLRAGLPPADLAAPPRRGGRALPLRAHRRRRQHLEALQRLGPALRAVLRRLPPVERVRGLPHAGHDPRTGLSRCPTGPSTSGWRGPSAATRGGYHAPLSVLAIGMGCEIGYARELVYADGVDLESAEAVVPVGVTCRLCERSDCAQRAFPALQHRLRVNENVRGLSFFAPVEER